MEEETTVLKKSWILTASMVIVALGLQGCMESAIRPVTQTSGPCIGSPGGSISGFEVKVTDYRWVNQVMRAGYENMPKNYRSQAYLKPQISFLKINLDITNTSDGPLAWNNPSAGYSFEYQLVNTQGTRYAYSQEASNIIYKTGLNNLNPGVPVKGTVVFDVPRGNYTFEIIKNQYSVMRRFYNNSVFQCSLGS